MSAQRPAGQVPKHGTPRISRPILMSAASGSNSRKNGAMPTYSNQIPRMVMGLAIMR
jgi:hypothetical protein